LLFPLSSQKENEKKRKRKRKKTKTRRLKEQMKQEKKEKNWHLLDQEMDPVIVLLRNEEQKKEGENHPSPFAVSLSWKTFLFVN